MFREFQRVEMRIRVLEDRLRRVEQQRDVTVGEWVLSTSGPSGPGQQLIARNTVTNVVTVVAVA